MSVATPTISPLRQRMIEDMRMRKLANKTQTQYLRNACQFAAFLGRSPDTARTEDLRRYQLHLVDHGTSSTTSPLRIATWATMRCPRLACQMRTMAIPLAGAPTSFSLIANGPTAAVRLPQFPDQSTTDLSLETPP